MSDDLHAEPQASEGRILITRPKEQALAFAKELEGEGYSTLCIPALQIKLHPCPLEDITKACGGVMPKALIFTSANGVRAIKNGQQSIHQSLRDILAYTVGQSTAEAALEAGFEDIRTAIGHDGNARDLTEFICKNTPPAQGVLLHVAGRDLAYDVAATLRDQGYDAQYLCTYETAALNAPPLELIKALQAQDINGVVFFSSKSAKAFAAMLRQAELEAHCHAIKALCLGQSMLEYVRSVPWQKVYVCDKPDRSAMLALIKEHI